MEAEKEVLKDSLEEIKVQMDQNRQIFEDYSGLIQSELQDKRTLNNHLQDLKGNIRVYVRLRPLGSSDAQGDFDPNAFQVQDNTLKCLIKSKVFE